MNYEVSSAYRLINICLIPDLEQPNGQLFLQHLVELSQDLNTSIPSSYELVGSQHEALGIYSLGHATVMHLKVEMNAADLAFLDSRLMSLINQPFHLHITELPYQSGFGFVRDNILAGTEPQFVPMDIAWASVAKSPELMRLQGDVVKALGTERVEFLTRQGQEYAPHFTLWASMQNDQDGIKQKAVLERHARNLQGFFVPCRLVFGTVGPIGQVGQVDHESSAGLRL